MIKMIAIGIIGRDAELSQSKNGNAYAKFSIAVSKKIKGEYQTTWISCVMFGDRAQAVAQYIQKGVKCYVEGEPSANAYTDKQGQVRGDLSLIVQDVQFLSERKQQDTPQQAQQHQQPQQHVETKTAFNQTAAPMFTQTEFTEDDIPF